MRSRLTFITIAMLVSSAIGYGVSVLASSSAPRPQAGIQGNSWLGYKSNLPFDDLFATSRSVEVAESDEFPGGTTHGRCFDVRVNPRSLDASAPEVASCANPATFGEHVMLYDTGWGTGYNTGRIAHVGPGGTVQLGPALFRVEDTSGSTPVWAYGDGFLWIYELEAQNGPTVFQVSEETGALVQGVSVPAFVRPISAADANGMYLAGAGSWGAVGSTEIVRVIPGLSRAQVVLRTPSAWPSDYADWIAAAGNDVWADICQRPSNHCEVSRYSRPDLRSVVHQSDNGGASGIIGDAGAGFVADVPSLSVADSGGNATQSVIAFGSRYVLARSPTGWLIEQLRTQLPDRGVVPGVAGAASRLPAADSVLRVRLFRRKHQDSPAHVPEAGSLEEAEQNPELLAAEQAVDRMPYSVPLMNPVSNGPASEHLQADGAEGDQDPPN